MAVEANLTRAEALFPGTVRALRYEIFADGADVTAAHAAMEDVATWTFAWELREAQGLAPHRTLGALIVAKASGAGIAIEGTYDSDRAVNTQRVVVTLDSDDLAAVRRGGTFEHRLRRSDSTHEAVLSFGTVPVLLPVPA